MPEIPTQSRATNADILRQVGEIRDRVNECHRLLRGHDESPGVIARMDMLERLITNDLKHLREKVDELASRNTRVDDALQKKDESIVRWPYLLEKFFSPVMVAVIIYLITHYFFK